MDNEQTTSKRDDFDYEYHLGFGGRWTIGSLPPGSLFEFEDGEVGLKTEYRTDGCSDCYLLDTGERVGAHITEDTPVVRLNLT